jgi:hypothetical protein
VDDDSLACPHRLRLSAVPHPCRFQDFVQSMTRGGSLLSHITNCVCFNILSICTPKERPSYTIMAHQPFRDRSVLSKIGYILAGSLWLVGLFCTLCWLPVIQYIRKRTQKTPVERKRQTSRVPPLPQFPTPRQRALTLPLDAPSATQYTLDQSKSIFFSKLPLELRRKVYSYALGRKIVHLTWDRKYMHGIRCSEETRCSHRTFEAQPDCDMGISTSLLRSCRQM